MGNKQTGHGSKRICELCSQKHWRTAESYEKIHRRYHAECQEVHGWHLAQDYENSWWTTQSQVETVSGLLTSIKLAAYWN